ncbi:MAG: PRTRC system protein C [Desulfobulbia bacterium]
MALEISGLPRKFKIDQRGDGIVLDDPNESMAPEQVRDLLALTYPDITSGAVRGPEIKEGYVLYTITNSVGVKG